ncbi:GMC oxidoreductase [Karstenula rhodostoma CBS 690.94]|uniref:GMC oxidoreductase n=1 Tax=Karstenula rhodostoma CBS 690.94 TaxID=1392251 RepID=A0A9P4PB25_9PLEO|nr:GMC oxidoreductase [Karstenula rhodostoma CBS 690.94]
MIAVSGLSFASWAFIAISAHAHPLFNGVLVERAEDLSEAYDYVVVGAGATGLTVANRLSEDPAVTVLVIEAGQFDQNEDFVTIPGLAGGAVGTKYDWNTSYTANDALGGRVVSIPQGKVVGGSTKLNRMAFDRGSKSDYNVWESFGNSGWNFEGILPYFRKNENFTPPTEEVLAEHDIKWDLAFHGQKGPMHSSYSPFIWPTTKNLINATKEFGIYISNDQASGNAYGGYYCPHNLDPVNVTRSSAKEAYYDTASARQNFHIITGNQVTQITIEAANGVVKVTGVEFASSSNATRQTVSVSQEAILAAGALHTPQLLQVSGIGDPAHLKNINVEPIVALPAVGQNLHDHVSAIVVNIINTTILTGSALQNATFAAQARQEYDAQRKGPYSSPTADFLLFLPVSVYSNESASIHAQASAGNVASSLPSDATREVVKGYQAQYDSLTSRLLANDSGTLEIIWADGAMVLGLQHPYSRGSVKAASSSIFDPPIADSGFLRSPLDVLLLREGIKFARRFIKSPSLAALNPFEVVPGANVTSDADLDEFIRGSVGTLYHPAGSCKMGPKEEGGVVDGELKVYGVQGLRVVDQSVFPQLPASHTMTTAYGVAEKAADIIRGVQSK